MTLIFQISMLIAEVQALCAQLWLQREFAHLKFIICANVECGLNMGGKCYND